MSIAKPDIFENYPKIFSETKRQMRPLTAKSTPAVNIKYGSIICEKAFLHKIYLFFYRIRRRSAV